MFTIKAKQAYFRVCLVHPWSKRRLLLLLLLYLFFFFIPAPDRGRRGIVAVSVVAASDVFAAAGVAAVSCCW